MAGPIVEDESTKGDDMTAARLALWRTIIGVGAAAAVLLTAVAAPATADVPARAESMGWTDDGTPFLPVPSFPDPSFPDPSFPDPSFPNPAPKPSATPSPSTRGPAWINLTRLSEGVGGPAMVVDTPYILWGCLASSRTSYALYPLADGSAVARPLSKGTVVGKSTDCTRKAPYLIRFDPLSVPASKVAKNGTFSFRLGTYRSGGGNPRYYGGYTAPVFTSYADCARNGYTC